MEPIFILPYADKLLLKQLHKSALEIMTLPEWIAVIREVEKAGGIRNVDGYAFTAIEKAKSFGGDRGAAGRYAAQIRWGRNSGGAGGRDGSVATQNPAGKGDVMNHEKIAAVHAEAMGAATSDGERAALTSASENLKASRTADVRGDALGAWERASQAEFTVSELSQQRGASSPVRRLARMLKELVLDLTDEYYAMRAA
jgi:hypothetical protein